MFYWQMLKNGFSTNDGTNPYPSLDMLAQFKRRPVVSEAVFIDMNEIDELRDADAIILAVSHDDFIAQGWTLISRLLNSEGGIVYDIKSTLDRKNKPENINLFRL